MADVARAAGVGVGTVYRHFTSREALIEAAAEQRFAEILEYARTDCRHGTTSGTALERYLRHVGEVLSSDRGLSAAVLSAMGSSAPRGDTLARLADAVAELIESDRAAGGLRTDVTVGDVYMMVGGLSGIIRTGSGDWRRFLDLAFQGLLPRA